MGKCSSQGCEKLSECMVCLNGTTMEFCREHIPQLTIARTKDICSYNGCIFNRTYGTPNRRGAIFCKFHATREMIHCAARYCDFPGCNKNPIFGIPGTKHPICCGSHKLPNMVTVRGSLCACGKQATHNLPNEKKPLYCAKCAAVGMANVKTRKCEFPGCSAIPSFGQLGSKHATHCATHGIKISLVDIKHPTCEAEGCHVTGSRHTKDCYGQTHWFCSSHGIDLKDDNPRCEGINVDGTKCDIHPMYGLPGTKKAQFCKKHSQPGMINVKAILCPCGIRPSFNLPGQLPRFCEKCKTDGMINVVNPTCEYPGCRTRPSFANPDEQQPRFCLAHKEPGMENVYEERCSEPGCSSIHPCFGYRTAFVMTNAQPDHSSEASSSASASSHPIDARYCCEHKKPGMEDVVHPYCSCPRHKRATFVVPGNTTEHFCFVCRPPNAITENPICEGSSQGDDCDIRASYGPLFGPARHCATHGKELGPDGRRLYCEFANRYPKCIGPSMIVSSSQVQPIQVEPPECALRPTFSNREDNFPTHCPMHAPPHAREIEIGECSSCHIPDLLNRISHLCIYCETGGSRAAVKDRHHRKEMRMMELLTAEDFEPTAHDKALPELLQQGIKSRPDFFFDYDDIAIILEVDENQHANRGITFIPGQVPVLLEFPPDYTCPLELAPIDPDKNPQRENSIPALPSVPLGVPPTITRRGYTRNHELARMIHIQHALGKPVFFVRYNPDEFIDASGKRHGISRGNDRDMIAINLIRKISTLSDTMPSNQSEWNLYIAYLCYNGQSYGTVDSFRVNPDNTSVERYAL